MKKIKLTQGKEALVDDEDFEKVNKYKWRFDHGYARTALRGSKQHIYLHRMLLQTQKGFETDHINRNKLDNRRKNLRSVTFNQNVHNRDKSKTNTSGYKGVSWFKHDKKWKAQIYVNRKNICLGLFLTKEEAALVYDQMAIKYRGEFAYLNNA